jgi:hypothetical protein
MAKKTPKVPKPTIQELAGMPPNAAAQSNRNYLGFNNTSKSSVALRQQPMAGPVIGVPQSQINPSRLQGLTGTAGGVPYDNANRDGAGNILVDKFGNVVPGMINQQPDYSVNANVGPDGYGGGPTTVTQGVKTFTNGQKSFTGTQIFDISSELDNQQRREQASRDSRAIEIANQGLGKLRDQYGQADDLLADPEENGAGSLNEARGYVDQLGVQDLARIAENQKLQAGNGRAALASRGLGNSTLLMAADNTAARTAEDARLGVSQMQAQKYMDLSGQLANLQQQNTTNRAGIAQTLGNVEQQASGNIGDIIRAQPQSNMIQTLSGLRSYPRGQSAGGGGGGTPWGSIAGGVAGTVLGAFAGGVGAPVGAAVGTAAGRMIDGQTQKKG